MQLKELTNCYLFFQNYADAKGFILAIFSWCNLFWYFEISVTFVIIFKYYFIHFIQITCFITIFRRMMLPVPSGDEHLTIKTCRGVNSVVWYLGNKHKYTFWDEYVTFSGDASWCIIHVDTWKNFITWSFFNFGYICDCHVQSCWIKLYF